MSHAFHHRPLLAGGFPALLALTAALAATPAAAAPTAPAGPAIEAPSAMQVQDLAHRGLFLRLPAASPSAWPIPPLARRRLPAYTTYNGAGLTREVLGFATYYELEAGNLSDVQLDKLSTLAFFGLTYDGNGNFYNDSAHAAEQSAWNSQALAGLATQAHADGDRVVLVVKCFDDATINAITGNASAAQNAISNAIGAVRSHGWDGINVDFEGSTSSSYPNIQQQYTSWIASLDQQLKQAMPSATLTVDSYSGSASWDSGFMRIDTLAPHVDAFFIMAYDMTGETAAPNAPLAGPYTYTDTSAVQQYLSKTGGDGSKVILGVPYYGYKFSTTDQTFEGTATSGPTAVTYSDSQADFQCAAGPPDNLAQHWDAPSSTPWATWWSPAGGDPCGGNHGSWRTAYYDDSASLGDKYDLVNSSNIRGTGIWALGYDHGYTDLWNEIGLKFFGPPPPPPPVVPRSPCGFGPGVTASASPVAATPAPAWSGSGGATTGTSSRIPRHACPPPPGFVPPPPPQPRSSPPPPAHRNPQFRP
jgi:spore germination protein YaaH